MGRQNPQGYPGGSPRGTRCLQNKSTATQEITACTPQNKNMLPTNAPPRCMQEGLSWAGKPQGDPGGAPQGHPNACKTKATTDHNMHTCRHQHDTTILKASAGWGKACYAPHMQNHPQHQQILPPAPAFTCMLLGALEPFSYNPAW